ncbi:MAG: flavodoxin [Prevotella sp.]|nr:flavodoxin [Prevotella sp.]
MKRLFFIFAALSVMAVITACNNDDDFNPDNQESDEIRYDDDRKILVAYFSATGNTQRLAEQIVNATGADVFRIEAAEPYAANPYDDSDRIQNESYNNLRPEVAVLPDNVEDYDVIFVGSPIWWHNPAMVVCTFLEHYDLSDKIVVPFFTYGATTYLQQSIDKIYEVTPKSRHLNTYTGGSVENWLRDINILK